MAKIIQIIDVGSDGTHVRLNDGSFVTLDHNAGWSPSIGDEVPHVEKSGTPTKSPRHTTTESRPSQRRKLKGSTPRMMKDYEDRCPLLGSESLDRLEQFGEQRETQLFSQIEASAMYLRLRLQDLEGMKTKSKRKHANSVLQQEATVLRQDIVGAAAEGASEGVQEFAESLLSSQKRLGVHADLLRDYTAHLVRGIRNMISTSELYRTTPRLPWQQDSIAQKAIQKCEEILAERWKIGDGLPYGANELNGSNPAWSPVVQDWEAMKGADKIDSGWPKRIPESVLRTILSTQHRVKPNDVTQEQIRQAGSDLCLHYGSILVIPLEAEASEPPKPEPESMATAQFWKEREDEFRAHAAENRGLFAEWSSISDAWTFHAGSGLESPPPGSEQVFKAMAREAAKGLVGPRSAEPSNDWLDALRRKTDKSTGRRLYSKVSTTSTSIIEETWLARMAKLGESVPPRGMIEFVAREGGPTPADQPKAPKIQSDIVTIEQRLFWDVTTEKIEHLFTSSANLCLELRSKVVGTPKRPTPMPAHYPIRTVPEPKIDIPELCATTERELMLHWENALEERNLTGKHFHWHDGIRDRSGHIVLRRYVNPLRQIGVRESLVVAELRFNGLAGAYFDLWDRSGQRYEVFQDWFPAISRTVLRDTALIWKGRDAALDEWYEKVCRRAINAELKKLAERWTNKARNRELLKLENTKFRHTFPQMSVSPPLPPTDNVTRSESDSAIPKAHSETQSPRAETPARVAAQGAAVDGGPLSDSRPGPIGSTPIRPEGMKPAAQEDSLAAGGDPVCAARCDLLLRFKVRGRNIGIRITDEMVAHAANPKWNDRTMVTWWKRNDPRCKQPHDRKIRAVLASDPSSSWTPNVKSKRSLK